MNLSESMKHVFKHKSQSIFSSLVKEDFKVILKGLAGDLIPSKFHRKTEKKFSIKESLVHMKHSVQGTALLLREIPHRLNHGFHLFQQELLAELEKLPDQKQKTMFCMKVLAGLSKLALSSAYDVGIGETKLLGLGKAKKALTHAVAGKLMFRTIQAFIVRFIQEVEKEITDPVELKNLQNFRDIVLDDSGNAIDKFFEGVTDPDDRAFGIVENFRNYIMTGELEHD